MEGCQNGQIREDGKFLQVPKEIEGFASYNCPQILIRQCYVYFWQEIERRMALNPQEKPKRALIRGSPGVGKTSFLHYLASCLCRKYGSSMYVEYRRDTKEEEGTIRTSIYGEKSTAALKVYLDDGLDVSEASQHGWDLIVLVASPQLKRYKQYEVKPRGPEMNWVMPQWTIDELRELATIQDRDAAFITQTLPRRYNLFGGTARYCLMTSEDPVDSRSLANHPTLVSALEDLEVKSIDMAEFPILLRMFSHLTRDTGSQRIEVGSDP